MSVSQERTFCAALQHNSSDHTSFCFLALRPRRGLEYPHRGQMAAALALEQQGQPNAAITAYRSVLQQHPTHSVALLQLAAIVSVQVKPGLAHSYLERLVAAHPDHHQAHSLLTAQQRARVLDLSLPL